MEIQYRIGNDLPAKQVSELYRASTLSQRRPTDSLESMAAMLQHSNLVVTAWDGELLVGISRSFTDFVYITYLSDLAVHREYQRKGIGRELIVRTQQQAPAANLFLAAAPAAVEYYPRLGFTQHQSAWWLNPGQALKG